jgi:hypothetical protein
MTGVVVPVATEELKSVPVVPSVNAATEVTVPVPAPIAVRKVGASNALTELSALIRKNEIVLGFVSVNKLEPTVVAPRFVLAPDAVVAPVPPLRIATVPVTFEEVPVVFWFNIGMSDPTIARNVGTPAVPLGAAKTKLAVLEAYGF